MTNHDVVLTATSSTYSPEQLVELDKSMIIHPYLSAETTERVVMVSGSGSRLWDADGREYLDATGGLWLAQVGHGRSDLAAVAQSQIERLEYFTSFWEFSNERAIELATKLVELSPPNLDHVYFTSGGTEGNEAALRMARLYHYRRGEPDRTWILSRRFAYHGVGFGSGTATGYSLYHDGFGPVVPHIRHLAPPWPLHADLFDGQDPTDFCVAELEHTIDELGASNIAALIGEPIMGVGGMIVPPKDYWPRIAETLQQHGILLIFDEVVTAYGRTGEWFGAQYFGVEPDLLVTAKGITSGYIPLGAVLVSAQVAEALLDGGFPIGYTYNGHPTACAVALANLEIIEREGLLARAAEVGGMLLQRLEPLLDLPIVGDVRGVGMMLGVELVEEEGSTRPLRIEGEPLSNTIRRDHGLIVRHSENDVGHTLVLSPPLVLSEAEAGVIVDVLTETLQDLSRRLGHLRHGD